MDIDSFDLSDFLPYRLSVLSERISRRLAAEYGQSHGLMVAEWRVLVHLARCRAVSVRDIHDRVDLDKPRVSRAVARLEQAGLVAKTAGKTDSRLVAITLTPAGRTALEAILPKVLAVETRLMASLSPQERRSLAAILTKLHGVLDRDPKARPRSRIDLGDGSGCSGYPA